MVMLNLPSCHIYGAWSIRVKTCVVTRAAIKVKCRTFSCDPSFRHFVTSCYFLAQEHYFLSYLLVNLRCQDSGSSVCQIKIEFTRSLYVFKSNEQKLKAKSRSVEGQTKVYRKLIERLLKANRKLYTLLFDTL